MARIVVGVDASDDAARAVAWAFDEARLRHAELLLVHTYAPHALSYPVPDYLAEPEVGDTRSEEHLQSAHDALIDEVLATVTDTSDVPVSRIVRPGNPAAMLCEVAAEADLLVVGARGLGGFRGLLLGSVSQQVVAHSPCPVVVVTPERQ